MSVKKGTRQLGVCGADSNKSPKYDYIFKHFAVIIRKVTAKC